MSDRYLFHPFFLDEPLPELEALAGPDWRINRAELPESTTQARMTAAHLPLADAVAGTLTAGERPVVVSGDCCATIAVGAGLQRAGVDPVLVWLDAHGDFNTWDTTPSGFIGGMPLAMLVGYGDPTLADAVGLEPLAEDRVVLTDARDLDPEERKLLESTGVRHLGDPRQLLADGLPEGPLWVHLDVDVVDPSDVPAVPYPAPGGLRAPAFAQIFRALAARADIAAVSLSTWDPKLDRDGTSRDLCLRLLAALLGRRGSRSPRARRA